jgi:hypothetical protein
VCCLAQGFYLKYEDDVTPESVRSWDVHVLKLSHSKRHLDNTTALAFWQQLEKFVHHRPQLHATLNC